MAKKKTDDDQDADDKPKSDAYVGLLAITLVAVIAGAVLMFMDHSEIETAAKSVQAPSAKLFDDGLEYKQAGKAP